MGRGRLLKTKVKEAKAVAQATREGTLKAEEKFKDTVADATNKFLEMLKNADPVDLALYGGLAVLSQQHNLTPLWGPIALKLATAPSGQGDLPSYSVLFGAVSFEIPLSAQIVGLTMLGILGLAPLIEAARGAAEADWLAKWKAMSCEERRSEANLRYFVLSPSAPPFMDYMEGFQDKPWGTPGAKYLECVANR